MALLATLVLAFVFPGTPDTPRIAPAEAYLLVRRGEATLIDVREQDEIADGMAAPARSMPLSRIRRDPEGFAKSIEAIPSEQLLIFYCAKGGRAEMAARMARGLGRRVRNMGGFSDWVKEGLPIRVPTSSGSTAANQRTDFAPLR